MLTATLQFLLIVLIIGLLLANWMPAIYQSDWFQKWRNPPAPEQGTETTALLPADGPS